MSTPTATPQGMDLLHKRALWLSCATVSYNVLEGTLAVAAGWFAGSVALLGFGVDSFIESLSGMVMLWRFGMHGDVRGGELERIEQRAVKLISYSFLALATYVMYESANKLYWREVPEPSLFGVAVAIASLVVMPALFFAKYRTGKAMGSRSLVADSKQTLACMMLSVILLAGLALNYLCELWWADPTAGLLIAALVAREGWHTLQARELCCG
jgi:divalent metal cation (Fe/Co/Zn/Cd) transporter